MEYITANQEVIFRMIIAVIIIAFVITTLKAVIKGIFGGIKITKDMLNGIPADEIVRKDKEEYEKRKEIEKERLRSKIYKITHPLELFNNILEGKLLDLIKKGKDNGKTKI